MTDDFWQRVTIPAHEAEPVEVELGGPLPAGGYVITAVEEDELIDALEAAGLPTDSFDPETFSTKVTFPSIDVETPEITAFYVRLSDPQPVDVSVLWAIQILPVPA